MSKQINSLRKKHFPIAKFVFVIVIIGAIAFGGFYFYKYQDLNDKYQELTKSQEDKNKEIISQVAKLYNIPSFDQEQPTIYFIKDKNQLGGSEFIKQFFESAQNNDVVIAYKNADISIIFRPSENKIIKTDNYANFLAATSPINVAIIAPSASFDVIEKKLKSQYKNVAVTSKSEPSTTIATGLVVDVQGEAKEAASALAKLLGYTVGQMPADEKTPEGAALVIIAPTTTDVQ